ncbi:MAG: hypothetical protein IJE19_03330 [Clostridia bacterium]|nr:hypothetical protein [Clostridia bacterium]
MDNYITLNLEKESAIELIETLRKVESYDDVYEILTLDEYDIIDKLREVLLDKVNGNNE